MGLEQMAVPGFAREPNLAAKLVTLNALWWEGDAPKVGDWLGTSRGRTSYQIAEVIPRRTGGYRLRCSRVPRGHEPEGAASRYHCWTWAPRGRKAA